jgi:ADP-ribosylglycohydrolase
VLPMWFQSLAANVDPQACRRRRAASGARRGRRTAAGGGRRHEEVSAAVAEARAQATDASPSPEGVHRIREGWVAEEALAIAVYSVCATRSFRDAVITAVNHGGDSDSTARSQGTWPARSMGWAPSPRRGSSHWSYET